MSNAIIEVPPARNEPVLSYGPGSAEKAALKAALADAAAQRVEIPCIVGGKRIATGRTQSLVMPHNRRHVLATIHCAGPDEVKRAVAAAAAAKRDWETMRWEARVAIFLRAAELVAGPRRMAINAATMLGQSKTCHQAEIDSACELIDFWRFNCSFARQLYEQQPLSPPGTWNTLEYRPLEGFVFALTPFNFTAIGGNLPAAPALMGNTVLWKPSEPQSLSALVTYLVLEEAGLPPGVINFLPGSGPELAPLILDQPDLGGIHFTGSSAVFRSLWQRAAANLAAYRSYPRIVGETGGKDFLVAHPSADEDAVIAAIVRGGYEYQGQKCSALSRVYIAETLWRRIRDRLLDTVSSLTMGDVSDFRNFMGAVINEKAFDKHQRALGEASTAAQVTVAVGGECDSSRGWFVRPTLLVTEDPQYSSMRDELFGPIVTLFVFADAAWEQTLELVDRTSPYGLTGAVFARDRAAIERAGVVLRHSAGNFYINDKPTGAVVGQQPFGGSRASGTNDKAGSLLNLLRWISTRAIKENFVPSRDYRYPFLNEM